jgi:hypothetical protein
VSIPRGFQFSQGSLQDFVDCPRRFQLRYLLRLAWPAIESEPTLENERYARQGAHFHRLAQQHVLGLPTERLERMIQDVDLECWWGNYLSGAWNVASGACMRCSEVGLYTPLDNYRLAARYDALALVEPENGPGRLRMLIIDWKTSRKLPGRAWLAERLQTRVYPYVLARAGACFNKGAAPEPEQVEMVYWFASFPDQPVRFAYSHEQLARDEAYLLSLTAQIEALGDVDFPLADSTDRCRYCTYRSLCDRGQRAGDWLAEDDGAAQDDPGGGLDFDLDFEQVGEIKF